MTEPVALVEGTGCFISNQDGFLDEPISEKRSEEGFEGGQSDPYKSNFKARILPVIIGRCYASPDMTTWLRGAP